VVASSPHDTETIGVTYIRRNWDLGLLRKEDRGRHGHDNAGINQALANDPFNITNL